jgi:hypothetical protein
MVVVSVRSFAVVIGLLIFDMVHAGATSGIPVGTWRISAETTEYLDCPWGAEACLGGLTYGNISCAPGYVGPLCALCDTHKFMEPAARVCEECSNANIVFSIGLLLIFTLVVPLVLYRYLEELVAYLRVTTEADHEEHRPNKRVRRRGEDSDDEDEDDKKNDIESGSIISIPSDGVEYNISLLMKHVARIKIFVSTYQVTSCDCSDM